MSNYDIKLYREVCVYYANVINLVEQLETVPVPELSTKPTTAPDRVQY